MSVCIKYVNVRAIGPRIGQDQKEARSIWTTSNLAMLVSKVLGTLLYKENVEILESSNFQT